ncbi:MAG: hypothetical protein M3O71_10325 [Bacteroidota bacterium]|nr:hypothetical protein [Bacteroidota bacterium]
MNKLSFSDINKLGSNVVSGNVTENKKDFKKFIENTKKKQAEVLKLKEINDQQLKITFHIL